MHFICQLEAKLNLDLDPKFITDPYPNLQIISDPYPQHWSRKIKPRKRLF